MVFLESLVNVVVKTIGYIVVFVYIGGIIWVVLDADKMRKRSENKKGLPSIVWLFLCLFFWNFAVPIYWILRKPRNIWKSLGIIIVFWISPILLIGTHNFFLIQRQARIELEKQEKYEMLRTGMTSNEVREILGMPMKIDEKFNVETKMNVDIWIYAEEEEGIHIVIFDVDAEPETLIDNIYYDSETGEEIHIGKEIPQ